MDIEVMTLCDAATESAGKLNLLGAFNRIVSRQFPATHPQCAIAMRLRFQRIEEGQHRLRINFVDDDGRPVLPNFDAALNISAPPDEDVVVANLILKIQALKFDKPGHYSIDLAVDGRHEKSLDLIVKELPKQPA